MLEFFIREMTKEDIRSVIEIERLCFAAPWSEASFFNELFNPRSITRLLVAGGRPGGYICANQIADEGHILDLAVHPDFRRKGIARALVEDILQGLKTNGCRFVYLEVRFSSEAARKLYEGLGFRMVGTRKEYYNNPREDAVIMKLDISVLA